MGSFIGDMWKCAIYIKHQMENDIEFKNVKVIQRYIGNKYCYIVTRDYDINNGLTTFDSKTLLHMHQSCNTFKKVFNIDFKFFISTYNTGIIIS